VIRSAKNIVSVLLSLSYALAIVCLLLWQANIPVSNEIGSKLESGIVSKVSSIGNSLTHALPSYSGFNFSPIFSQAANPLHFLQDFEKGLFSQPRFRFINLFIQYANEAENLLISRKRADLLFPFHFFG
jgi:hypothetical protein